MKVFVLEDNINRCKWFSRAFIGHRVDFATNVTQGIELLQKNTYDLMFLDHDLAEQHYESDGAMFEDTGYEAVVWMVNNNYPKTPQIIVHSLNPDGAKRMYNHLVLSGYNAQRITFLELPIRLINEK